MQATKKSIFFKAKYLSEEFKEVKEKFEDYCVEFFKEVNKSQNLNMPQEPEVPQEPEGSIVKADPIEKDSFDASEDDPIDNLNISDKLKKLYKRIALITHPDRHPEYLSKDKRKEMIDIYNRSSNAIRENDLFSLLDAASELYLDLPKLEKKELKNIKKKCLEFEKNINDIKNTYPWVWGEGLDSSGREHIIKAFIDSIHKD
jgi:hypothetical protein